MNLKFLFLFLVQATINGVNLTIAQAPSNKAFRCSKNGMLSSDSLQKHRDIALDSLVTNIVKPEYTGYLYTHSSSEKPGDRINVAVLCPPNIKAESCAKCIKETIPYLKQNCPNQKEGVAWTLVSRFINCMVRYADYEFEGRHKSLFLTSFSSPNASARSVDLKPVVKEFGNLLSQKAARGGKLRRYQSGKKIYAFDTNTIYMAVQCTPDIPVDSVMFSCTGCIKTGIYYLEESMNKGKVSARTVTENCYVRYDHQPVSPTSISSSATLSSSSESTMTTQMIWDDKVVNIIS